MTGLSWPQEGQKSCVFCLLSGGGAVAVAFAETDLVEFIIGFEDTHRQIPVVWLFYYTSYNHQISQKITGFTVTSTLITRTVEGI